MNGNQQEKKDRLEKEKGARKPALQGEAKRKRKPGAKQKKRTSMLQMRLLVLLLLVAGCCLMLYPWFSNQWNKRHQSRAIMAYNKEMDSMPAKEYKRLLKAARDYNKRLADEAFANAESGDEDAGTPDLSDLDRVAKSEGSSNTNTDTETSESADSEEDASHRKGHFTWTLSDKEKSEYESLLNYNGDGMIGYITIPKIKVDLPIYHGTSDAVLQTGAGHLMGSSLPIAGETVHSVISGHRGLPSAKLFTDLDQLRVGDKFSIKVLNQKTTYQVDKITMVDPTDFSDLGVTEGRDYVTLLTCTPYGINTERLLIRGIRVNNDGSVPKDTDAEDNQDTLKAEETMDKEQHKPVYVIRKFIENHAPIAGIAAVFIIFTLIVLIGNALDRRNERNNSRGRKRH